MKCLFRIRYIHLSEQNKPRAEETLLLTTEKKVHLLVDIPSLDEPLLNKRWIYRFRNKHFFYDLGKFIEPR